MLLVTYYISPVTFVEAWWCTRWRVRPIERARSSAQFTAFSGNSFTIEHVTCNLFKDFFSFFWSLTSFCPLMSGWSVCHNFQKRRKVPLPCSFRSGHTDIRTDGYYWCFSGVDFSVAQLSYQDFMIANSWYLIMTLIFETTWFLASQLTVSWSIISPTSRVRIIQTAVAL